MRPVRSITAIAALLGISLTAGAASAHDPNAMHVNYDKVRGQLNVIVQHLVNDKWKHYVDEVVVYKNGLKAWSQSFDFQTSFRNQTMPPIKLAAVDGDEFRVAATCNEGGKYEKTIAVGIPEEEVTPGPVEHMEEE